MKKRKWTVSIGTALLALPMAIVLAPVVPAQNYEPWTPANAQAQAAFSRQDLDQMLAPIALYPDALLSQILMAATYPVEVAQAARWSRANPGLEGDRAVRAVERTAWDPSVKSLVAFPQILTMMDEKLEWTERLGDAFLAQETQVMDSVQYLRQRAYAAGTLRSDDRIHVVSQGPAIVVVPANPQIVYVPYYDPTIVYGRWWWPQPPVSWAPWRGYHPPRQGIFLAWGSGIPVISGFFFGAFDWPHRQTRVVNVNTYYYSRTVVVNRQAKLHNPSVVRHVNTAPGIWRHNPEHRRSAPYRGGGGRAKFAAESAPMTPLPAQPAVQPQARAMDHGRPVVRDSAVRVDAHTADEARRAVTRQETRPETRRESPPASPPAQPRPGHHAVRPVPRPVAQPNDARPAPAPRTEASRERAPRPEAASNQIRPAGSSGRGGGEPRGGGKEQKREG